MKIDEILRYASSNSPLEEKIDGFKNYIYETHMDGYPKALLEKGINKPATIKKDGKEIEPVILLRSSAHKAGSEDTPWKDLFRPDFGHIRYFGDNKSPGSSPEKSPGNALLLHQYQLQHSLNKEDRLLACPILAFKAVTVNGKPKGHVQFQGVCLIERVERIVQVEPKTNIPFVNYSFDLLVISLLDENEVLNWKWINDRRDSKLSIKDAHRLAPDSWKKWVNSGFSISNQIRRSVLKEQIISEEIQRPPKNSIEARILQDVYSYYGTEKKKSRFEAVAAFVASRILNNNGGAYIPGWITQASSDNGIDFVGRLDIGSDFARTKLVVLGQAKCQSPDSATNANDIARTVARLRRGWIGIYITTSYFSRGTQKEVLEDQYPIVLVDGFRLAKELGSVMFDQGLKNTKDLLDKIDADYEKMLAKRSPEEVLLI
jgi:hypothetical protein